MEGFYIGTPFKVLHCPPPLVDLGKSTKGLTKDLESGLEDPSRIFIFISESQPPGRLSRCSYRPELRFS